MAQRIQNAVSENAGNITDMGNAALIWFRQVGIKIENVIFLCCLSCIYLACNLARQALVSVVLSKGNLA